VASSSGPVMAEMIKDSSFAHNLYFAIGCRAMIVRNSTKVTGFNFVNGDTGEVVDAVYTGDVKWSEMSADDRKAVRRDTPTYIRVRLDRGSIVNVPYTTLGVNSISGKLIQDIKGIPIALGYAYTIHKTQGMTIGSVYANIGTAVGFPNLHGLAYVALSRTKELSGVHLDAINDGVIYCDSEVLSLVDD